MSTSIGKTKPPEPLIAIVPAQAALVIEPIKQERDTSSSLSRSSQQVSLARANPEVSNKVGFPEERINQIWEGTGASLS